MITCSNLRIFKLSQVLQRLSYNLSSATRMISGPATAPVQEVDTRQVKTSRNLHEKSYIVWFSNEHTDFMKPELEALFHLFNISQSNLDKGTWYGPMVIMNFEREEDVRRLLSRSVLIRACYEFWASGTSMDELHSNFQNNAEVAVPHENASFRLRVETYGKKLSQTKKLEIIESFQYIPLCGPVDLSNPECSLHVIQYFDYDGLVIPENPEAVFLGRWIGEGQRNIVNKISLKTRKFIGNTSMDPLLSLLMANLALVKDNSVVYDPFVGTGSLLVAAAIMGGYVIGTDIDYSTIHAKSKPSKARMLKREIDESVLANLVQYGVERQYLDVLVADASLPLLRDGLKFDAILTDPPYGVRESIERIGSVKEDCAVAEEHLAIHYPQKVSYPLCDIFCDLIDSASQRLNIGGRLVCWIPIARHHYDEDHLPKHSCFQLVSNCEQKLSEASSRRLLVYEKIREHDKATKTLIQSDSLMYKFRILDRASDEPRRPSKKQLRKKQ